MDAEARYKCLSARHPTSQRQVDRWCSNRHSAALRCGRDATSRGCFARCFAGHGVAGVAWEVVVMFLTADMVLAHMVGDYCLQSDWMATEKRTRNLAAVVHAVCYTLPFLFLTTDVTALAVICVTHGVIDRWALARYVVWVKNFLAVPRLVWVGPWGLRSQRWGKVDDAVGRVVHAGMSVAPPGASPRLKFPVRPWRECRVTGFPADRPVWLASWLLIIVDNLLHVVLNGVALHVWA